MYPCPIPMCAEPGVPDPCHALCVNGYSTYGVWNGPYQSSQDGVRSGGLGKDNQIKFWVHAYSNSNDFAFSTMISPLKSLLKSEIIAI